MQERKRGKVESAYATTVTEQESMKSQLSHIKPFLEVMQAFRRAYLHESVYLET